MFLTGITLLVSYQFVVLSALPLELFPDLRCSYNYDLQVHTHRGDRSTKELNFKINARVCTCSWFKKRINYNIKNILGLLSFLNGVTKFNSCFMIDLWQGYEVNHPKQTILSLHVLSGILRSLIGVWLQFYFSTIFSSSTVYCVESQLIVVESSLKLV